MTPSLVIVTGAASGIGAAIAARLRQSHPVLGVDLVDPTSIDDGAHAMDWVTGDVGDPGTWVKVSAHAARRGGCHTLVLNAAKPCLGTVIDVPPDRWRNIFETNLFGSALALQVMLPSMIAAGGGGVVAISSVNARFAEQGLAVYNASKAALTALIRTVAVDHAHEGIRANVIEPGTVDTPAFQRVMHTASDAESFLASRSARNPIGRIIQPDEVAAVASFLCSPDASGMTGSVITVDGGLTASFDHRNSGTGYRTAFQRS